MTISPKSLTVPVGESETRLKRVFLTLTLAATGMAALLALLPAAGHDQIWFLLMAKRWLAGAQLYGPEIFDSNPPGVIWLSALPVMLGKVLHVQATAAGKQLVAAAETFAAGASLVFLRRGWRRELGYEFYALLLAATVLFYVVPARDFGQRDHLLSFLMLPYVLAAAVPWPAQRMLHWRLTAGLLAGIGICLKPHHALVPLSVEASLLLLPPGGFSRAASARLKHLFRPEPVTILCAGTVFLLALRQLAPLYFTVALPIARDTYWAVGRLSLAALVWQAVELCVLAVVAVALFFICKPRSAAVRTLLVAAAGASLAYLVQGTGWYYQQLPAITLTGFALALLLLDLLLLDLLRRKPVIAPHWLASCTGVLAVVALALTTHFMGYPFTIDRAFAIEEPNPAFFASLPRGTSVATLTTSVDEAMMPVERYGLTWAQRTNNLWLLPAILRSEGTVQGEVPHRFTGDRLAQLDALQHRWMVEDLERWKPALVLIERCQVKEVRCQLLEDRSDDLLAWFKQDPAFRVLWNGYSYAGTRGRFDAYTLKRER